MEDKLLELGRAIEARRKPDSRLCSKLIIYPPPVASSPLDRGWHIALTPLCASAIRDYLDVRAMNGCPAKALELVGSIAGAADKALGHGLTLSRGSDKRRSSGAWAGSTRPRHPLSSLAQNHLRAQARQPGLGSAECLWRRLEPLARSRRRRLRARWRGVHFRSPDRSGVLLAVRGAPCVAASPFYSAESLASRRTGRAQNTPLYAFRPASQRRRARDVGVVAPDL